MVLFLTTILLILVVAFLFGIVFVAAVFVTAIVATKASEGFASGTAGFIGATGSVCSADQTISLQMWPKPRLGPMPSDVAQMAEALIFALLVLGQRDSDGLLSVGILLFGLIVAFRE